MSEAVELRATLARVVDEWQTVAALQGVPLGIPAVYATSLVNDLLASLTGEGEPVAQDAKDAEITRLRADITALEDGNMTFLCDELDKAKAENARMREALEQIADGSAPPIPHGHYLAHRHAVNVARVALRQALPDKG